jgi:hypothetical protein
MTKLDRKTRDALPDSDFAVPTKRAMPIHDADHVRMAWNMVERMDLSAAAQDEARKRILERAEMLGVDTASWQAAPGRFTLAGGSLELAAADGSHPNKHPFKGILTRLDAASDKPPGGSEGKRVLLPTTVAAKSLSTLVGMAVDFTAKLDGHDKRSKIGLIEAAYIEGDALWIEGFFYAADFPEEVARIQAEQASLGFSYEVQAAIQSPNADPLVISGCTFTGAAVLYKAKAAYTTTSLAAHADMEIDMTPEELKAALGGVLAEQLGPLSARLDKLEASAEKTLAAAAVIERVKEHATALKTVADAMETDGIGLDPEYGHVVMLRKLAGNMEAAAAQGRVPYSIEGYVYTAAAAPAAAAQTTQVAVAATQAAPAADKTTLDAIAGLATKVADLQAAAFKGAQEPERKTLSPTIMSLLAKADITVPGSGEKLDVKTVDAALEKSGLQSTQRIAVKQSLMMQGAL